MSGKFFPSALEIARLRRKITVSELSKLTGLSTRELRRISRAEVQPTPESVTSLANALRYPLEFFHVGELEIPADATFRARTSMTKRESGAGLASAALGARLSAWLETEFHVPDHDIPDLSDMDPSLAADTLRAMWGLGERPIGNLIRLLEAKGVRVFSLSEETLRLDAFATWVDTRPFVFLNGVKSAERSRFDAAHELGHLCLHRDGQKGKEVEDEANAFASAFLMPTRDVIARRVFPTMQNLIVAKSRWGVALSALVRRYRDLGLVNGDRAKWLYIEMSRKGYLKKEPRPIRREGSAIWAQVLQALWQDRKSISDLAKEISLPSDEIESLIFVNRRDAMDRPAASTSSVRSGLRLVK